MCAGHLQEEITPASAPDILALADRHNMLRLKQVPTEHKSNINGQNLIFAFQEVIERILCDKVKFLADPEFEEKMTKQPAMLLELLANN